MDTERFVFTSCIPFHKINMNPLKARTTHQKPLRVPPCSPCPPRFRQYPRPPRFRRFCRRHAACACYLVRIADYAENTDEHGRVVFASYVLFHKINMNPLKARTEHQKPLRVPPCPPCNPRFSQYPRPPRFRRFCGQHAVRACYLVRIAECTDCADGHGEVCLHLLYPVSQDKHESIESEDRTSKTPPRPSVSSV